MNINDESDINNLPFNPFNKHDNREVCSRCKSRCARIFCNECLSFTVFCKDCDDIIHKLPSKKYHNRQFISEVEINEKSRYPNAEKSYEYQESNTTITPEHTSSYHENNKHKNNNNKNFNSEGINNGMKDMSRNIEHIKEIYNCEKQEIITEMFLEKNKLTAVINGLQEKISSLELKNKELENKSYLNTKQIKEVNEYTLDKLLSEKESQIKYLSNKNYELGKTNESLNEQNEKLITQLKENKDYLSNTVSNYNQQLNKVVKDNEEMKEYYEKKISFFTDNFVGEKGKIIEAYEKSIDAWNKKYEHCKKGYLNIIAQKEGEVSEKTMTRKINEGELLRIIQDLKHSVTVLQADQEKLIRMNNELKEENFKYNENLEKSKELVKQHKMEKEIILEQKEKWMKEYNLLEKKNKKMDIWTHGKLTIKKKEKLY